MKKRETKKTVLWAATDMALSVAAMAAAFFIRFVLFRGENPVGGFGYHMLWAGLFSPVYAVLFGLLGVYEPQPQRGFIHEFGNIVLGCTFGVMLYIDLIFVFRVVDFSRWMILLCYLLLIAFTGARGFIAHRLLRRQYRAGNGLRRLVIIGDGASARECLRRVKKGRDAGWTVIGSVGVSALSGVPHLGSYDSLRTALEPNAPDEAVIAMEENQAERLGGILRECEDTGVKLALLPIGYEYMSRHPYVEELCGLPLVNVRRVPLDNAGADIVKRLFDILTSLVLIVLTSPSRTRRGRATTTRAARRGGRSCGATPTMSCRSSLTSLRAICRSSARGRRSRGMSIISNTAFRFIWCAIRCAPASPAGHRSMVCAAIPPSARGWITISIISKTGRCCSISRSCL